MIKKLALVAVALAIAAPAFAKRPSPPPPTTNVTVGGANDTDSFAIANSGFNSVSGISKKGGTLYTGAAYASSAALTDVNTVYVTGGKSNVNVNVSGNNDTLSVAGANSGFNSISGKGTLGTGPAGAHSFVGSSINTVVVN